MYVMGVIFLPGEEILEREVDCKLFSKETQCGCLNLAVNLPIQDRESLLLGS